MIRGVALCAGVGGMELGLTLAMRGQYRCVGHCERDAYAAATLVARMEEEALDRAPVWDDLTTWPSRLYRGRVDLVSAGFPCQPWSAAGKKQGLDDPRWLWPWIWRAVREMDAPMLFLENVPQLRRGGLGVILADLAEAGWDAEWCCVAARDIGAPHKRERIFVLAWAADRKDDLADTISGVLRDEPGWGSRSDRKEEAIATDDGFSDVADAQGIGQREPDHAPCSVTRQDARKDLGGRGSGVVYPDESGLEGSTPASRLVGGSTSRSLFPPPPTLAQQFRFDPSLEPSFRRVVDGTPHRLDGDQPDRTRACGNAVVPLVVAVAFRRLVRAAGLS